MNLSEIGKIAQTCWTEIPNHFPFVNLDAFIVMPNHVHGILVINKAENGLNETNAMKEPVVETQNFASLPENPTEPKQIKNHFGPQSKNLASIIRGFKVGVTKNARLLHAGFAWQSRFYDHIIRNQQSYQTISE
jgi:REP element-mobilizing transposase RayT